MRKLLLFFFCAIIVMLNIGGKLSMKDPRIPLLFYIGTIITMVYYMFFNRETVVLIIAIALFVAGAYIGFGGNKPNRR